MAAKTKALCIFTEILGNRETTRRCIQILDRLPDLEPTYVILTLDDFVKYRAPWWARMVNSWEARYVMRKKARKVIQEPFDILLVHKWGLMIGFRDLARRMPAAAMMDAVPATMDRAIRSRGVGGWRRWLARKIHDRAFRKAAHSFRFFLPKSSDCAASLEHDYGIDRERCFVTLAPQDLQMWTPGQRSFSPPWRLLFAGNDFARKGGEFLLRLYSEHLAGRCTLTVASNDPSLIGRQLPAGVELVRGATREQMLQVYRDSHIFLFPTLQDFAPQVLAEASATGLPCIAREGDGIRDLVRDGETGFVMPRDASPEEWAAQVQRLLADPAELQRMSGRARQFAEEELNLSRFELLLTDIVERLRSEV
jgi:glycosyltransferase involved in cell wall biosynthesis